ncbi:hypothetical protein [Enhygromyxa salina]|uniref:Uncharacterized protein n=1 Tax=Enhygromyxa salina TaxID=215803 RepID=A0A2S9YI90_9BACT|nr:hypothetical protein [Enhygromyxa salina]PRQ04781.1 hypothetical protein ENSA7_49540 [Enhygromyxa salina]
MTIESVVIIIVGFAATVFLLSFSWRLWVQAPVPPAQTQGPRVEGPPLGPPPGAEHWMAWAQPGAPTAPPSPERELFEQSQLVPVAELMPNADGELDMARTMFFFKKDPEKTEILTEALDLESVEPDAPISSHSRVQTTPVRNAGGTRRPGVRARRGPPPPPAVSK